MNGMKQIFRKELARVFHDRKMLFSVFLLPVLIMVFVLSIVNNLMSKMEDDIDKHTPVICIQNEPESFGNFLDASKSNYKITAIASADDKDTARADVREGDADLIIEFPKDFDQMVAAYQEGDAIPQIKTYYNPSEDYSREAYTDISGTALETYRQTLLAQRVGNLDNISIFQVNADNKDMIIQDEKKANGKALGMMLPYFVTILLFAGAMGIGADMIAGEKERGTMASLLVSPVKRSSIVLGKVFSLMVITGISSLIYVAAMVICMPMMMKSMTGGSMNLQLSPQQILMLGGMLVALAFLYATIIALFSVFAKSTKEASTYIMPIYMLVLVVGLLTMFNTGEPSQAMYYIPLYNNAMVLQGILGQEVTMAQYLITLAETLVLGGILTGLIVKAFESEKVMAP